MSPTTRKFPLLRVLQHAVNACCTVELKSHTPNLGAIRHACDEIQALIPSARYSELEDLEKNPRYKTPFSRGVAKVLACLNLLYSQIPFPSEGEVASASREAIAGTISVCNLALFLQMENDEIFKMSQQVIA